jgi:hypothetical protein
VRVFLPNALSKNLAFYLQMGYLVHVGASIICPHAGQVFSSVASGPRVFVSSQPVVTVNDMFPITGCPFTLPNGTYHPCTTTKWTVPSARVRVNNSPVILQESVGMCFAADQAPQGPPNVVATQVRVRGV